MKCLIIETGKMRIRICVTGFLFLWGSKPPNSEYICLFGGVNPPKSEYMHSIVVCFESKPPNI